MPLAHSCSRDGWGRRGVAPPRGWPAGGVGEHHVRCLGWGWQGEREGNEAVMGRPSPHRTPRRGHAPPDASRIAAFIPNLMSICAGFFSSSVRRAIQPTGTPVCAAPRPACGGNVGCELRCRAGARGLWASNAIRAPRGRRALSPELGCCPRRPAAPIALIRGRARQSRPRLELNRPPTRHGAVRSGL